jgi:diaminopimelate epimerase
MTHDPRPTAAPSTVRAAKYQGLGNDFLVALLPEVPGDAAALARRVCARRTGVGADGLIVGTPSSRPDVDLVFHLWNADGSSAEISGNGIRCLAQAVLDAGLVAGPNLTVATAAGVRHLTVRPGDGPGVVQVSVDMGPVKVGPDEPQPSDDRGVRPVDMGNPHLVVRGPSFTTEDVLGMGSHLQSLYAGGVNVEFVTVGPGLDEIAMRVFERGVGETQACGTGACAAAAAVHEWGLVGPRVVVHQPGGDAVVELGPDTVVLTGPAQRIARVEVEVAP